jgi:hypothetical protein
MPVHWQVHVYIPISDDLLTTLNRSRLAAGAARAPLLFALAATSLPAFAGRPMTVDDAAIVAPGQCQLETYALQTEHRDEYWATPACNVGGAWELAVGGAWADDTSGPYSRTAHYGRVQAKTVFKAVETNGWGMGLVLADQFRFGGGNGDVSANVPVSFSLRDDAVLVHVNAGAMHSAAARRLNATWGTGAEFKLDERNSTTAEVFGQQRAGSRYQFGFARALIPDHLQIDATWGRRVARGASDPVVTLGLVLQTN